MREDHALEQRGPAPAKDMRLGIAPAGSRLPAQNLPGGRRERGLKTMPKHALTANQIAVIKSILGQMPEGSNWAQKESRHAIWLVAKDFGLEDDQKAAFKAAVDIFINPSACAQYLDSLAKENACYRKRVERAAKLDEYE